MDKKKVIIGGMAGLFLIVILCFLFSDDNGEDSQKTPQPVGVTRTTLESKYASGVVLLYNQTYYAITFKDVLTGYFSGIDEEDDVIGLTFDEDEVQPLAGWGTGFFISTDGKLATNCHVAAKTIDAAHARAQIINALASETDEFKSQINELNEKIATLNIVYMAQEDTRTGKKIEKLKKQREELQKYINVGSRISSAEYSVRVISRNYAAFHDTYITGIQDMRTCQLISRDAEHDLAIIQLADKQTPDKRHVFTLDNTDRISVEEPLYVIGYNDGPTLANTSVGIKAQITEGKMGQDRGDDFMHTITTAPGSSGSPILNKHGKVVGVNYAHLSDASDFKFGVKVKFLDELAKKSN